MSGIYKIVVTKQVHGLGPSTLRSFTTAEDGRPSGFDPTSRGSRFRGSQFSPAAGLKSGQFNQKRNLMDPQKIDVLAKALRREENII